VGTQGATGPTGPTGPQGATGATSSFTGGTLTSNLTLVAGATGVSPLTFQSGTNLSTATAGAFEYDGRAFYSTPNATSGRGLSPSSLIYRLDSSITGNTGTSAQNALGVSVTVPASTVYLFEFLLCFNKTAGTTSHTFTLAPGGTATLNNAVWQIYSSASTTAPAGSTFSFRQSSWTSTFGWNGLTAASVQLTFMGKGTVSVNASGTLNLTYTLSANPGGAYICNNSSYFMLTPIGVAGANTSIGAWA
jgi:hypothetical protein